MRAIIIKEHGDLDKLIHTEVPDPVAGPDEVLVKVRACALNHLDIWTRLGMPGVSIPMPHILGCDIAGEINGERVIVAPGMVPKNDPRANSDWESLSDDFKIIGLQVDGGYAEYVKVPARNVIRVSRKISFEEWGRGCNRSS